MKHTQKGNIKSSAVALHIKNNPSQQIDPSSALKLIEYEPRKFYKKLNESLYIQKCANKMNTNEGWKIKPIVATGTYRLLKRSV